MEANTDNLFCANGACEEGIGGTSLAAPRWAGFLALANEQANGSPIGFLNTTVYKLGQTSAYTSEFHDITTGNDFNSSSPDMFQAVPGYDLTTGWGTPNGASMLDALAPLSLASAPNFTLSASPTILNLTPGASASTAVTLTGTGGFAGAVNLVATTVGSPAGVTATLSTSTLTGTGSATLNVDTTAATPGGTYLVAVSGTSGGLMHTAYVQLALPDYTISASTSKLYLTQQSKMSTTLTVNPLNGFDSSVALTVTGTPPLVKAHLAPDTTKTTSKLTLKADVTAPTTPGVLLSINGVSGGTTRSVPSLSLAVSATTGICGLGFPVNLSSFYNLIALRHDKETFTDGGLDGSGSAYSSDLLTSSRVLNGARFSLGASSVPDAVYAAGQTIPLPKSPLPMGNFNSLQLFATGIDGNQTGQIVTVTYEDGTTAQTPLSFSDWYAPSTNVEEQSAVAMPYRNIANGTADNRQFNLYAYTILLDTTKVARSFTLPTNRAVVLFSATLTAVPLGTQVDLTRHFNATGIYTDGSMFSGSGGLDGGGAAYSAIQLVDTKAGGEIVSVGPSAFHLAGPNTPNVVYGAGQTIPLSIGFFSELKLLGTAVQGDQTAQPITVHYEDGTSETIEQSFSDWSSLSGYTNESLAIQTAYRDYNDGSQDQQAFNVYLYTLKVKEHKRLKSVTLPDNRNVVFLSITEVPTSVVELEETVCPTIDKIYGDD